MAIPKVINGTNLVLFILTGGTNKAIAFANSAKLSLEIETIETPSKNDGKWTSSIPGGMKWSVDSDSLVTYDVVLSGLSFKDITNLALNQTEVTISLGPTTADYMEWEQTLGSTDVFSGKCWITKIDVTAKHKDSASYSVNFKGNGELTFA